MEPRVAINNGARLLEPILRPFGFTFRLRESASTRGPGTPYVVGVARPAYAIGEFRRDDRFLELEFAWSLGPVTYHVNEAFLTHEDYLRALGIPDGARRYPGVSDDPLQAFRDLTADVSAYCSEFVDGSLAVFPGAAAAAAARRAEIHRRNMVGYVGDDSKRAQAREAFQTRDYRRVVELLASMKYPEYLEASERKILEIARRRVHD